MTDKLREAAQMALDALEHGLPIIEDYGGKQHIQLQHKTIAALYEALRAALANEFTPDWDAMAVMVEEQQRMAKRIEELEAELAQPEQEIKCQHKFEVDEDAPLHSCCQICGKVRKQPEQEPVAWFNPDNFTKTSSQKTATEYAPLYTAPPQREWQGLTDEEIREFEIWLDDEEEKRGWNPPADIVKYIEAKLRGKNT